MSVPAHKVARNELAYTRRSLRTIASAQPPTRGTNLSIREEMDTKTRGYIYIYATHAAKADEVNIIADFRTSS